MTGSSLDFGSVTAGSSKTLTVAVSNSGPLAVTVSSAAVTSKYFSVTAPSLPVAIAAGQSVTFSVSFSPNAAGTFNATLTLNSDASNSAASLPLSGNGTAGAIGQLSSNPTNESFGNVTVGNQKSQTFTLTNTGASNVDISQASISGTAFQLSGITTPLTLTPSQSTTFAVTFAPSAAGSVSGTVTIISDASTSTLTIPLSGAGVSVVGQLTASPATLTLGTITVGTSGTGSGTLTASGAAVTVTAASTNSSAFSISGLSLPVTIQSGDSVPFTVTFSPQTTGAASAVLTFTSNATPTTTSESLSGTGSAAPTYSVNLSWTASASEGISGYNVYRALYTSSCGAFSKINSLLDTSTVYTDAAVTDGSSYCYATTAVNSSNEESGYSNIVSNLQIPAP